MDSDVRAQQVRIYLNERDTAAGKHEPLWEVLLDLLLQEGAPGATVMRGMGGFGASRKIRLARLADIVPDLPIVLEWIDDPATVDRLLPHIRGMVEGGRITVEDVRVID